MWSNVDVENIYQHVLKTEGEKHPLYSPEKMEECADYILSEFKSYSLDTHVHEFQVDGLDYTFRNVEASIGEGKDPELLITSHYDTVRHAPGANDNGSAIAVMLEAARVLADADFKGNVRFVSFNLEEGNPAIALQSREVALAEGVVDEDGRYTSWHTAKIMKRYQEAVLKQIDSGVGPGTARTVAISEIEDDLEEHELRLLREGEKLYQGITPTNWVGRTAVVGSTAWVRRAVEEGREILGVLNLETMGYVSKEAGSQKFPEGLDSGLFEVFGTQEDLTVGDFLTVVADRNSGGLADAFCEQCRDDSIGLPYACLKARVGYEEAAYAMRDILRSDHAPFWREGIPALMLTDTANFRYPFYHTRADTIDKLDFDFLSQVCMATVATSLTAIRIENE